MSDSQELRQRKPKKEGGSKKKKEKKYRSNKIDEDSDYSPWLDILRVLSFLLLASCALSYLITSGKSFWWGGVKRPQVLQTDYWKAYFRGPIYLSPEELSAYDGQDPDKPLYLAINGTIYDVSNGRRIYGPGGSYNYFAGVDAARAYVTGCFAEDRTPDMRGVEEMFLPLDDPETDDHWSRPELQRMRVKELERAKEKAHDALKHWVDFFANSNKYTKVGYVAKPEGWLEALEPRELCAQAQKGRSKRKVPQYRKKN